MGARLVLGWDAPTRTLLEFERRTAGRLTVVTMDGNAASTLRDGGLNVIRADPSDTEALQEVGQADAILVAKNDAERNGEIADAARTAFPSARLVAYSGTHPTATMRARLESLADRVVEHVPEVGTEIVDIATSARAVRSHRVRALLDDIDGHLCVFMHDNPDPDALASAVALVRIGEARNVDARPYYFGEITHQSNRAFVNLLDLPIEQLAEDAPFPECDALALVDHALPNVNDSLPPEMTPDLIFDHHTPSGPVEGRYVDLRETVGATSSIMVEYLRQLEIDIDEMLATALLNGIRTDTKDFSRKVAPVDFKGAGFLWNHADHDALERIENPSLSRDTLGTIGEAIAQRTVRGPALSSCVGELGARDALSQSADLLLQMEGVEILLVYGIDDGAVHASARARPTMAGIDLASIMREAFGPIGTAGGHEEMAGARIPLGMLATTEEQSEDLVDVVRDVIDDRFFETVSDRLHPEMRFGGDRFISE